MTFDLNSFAFDTESRPLHLVSPADDVSLLYADKEETKPLRINLYGIASKQYKKAAEIMSKKIAKRGKRTPTSEEIREDGTEFLVAVTASVENLVLNGEVIETPEQIKALYSNPKFKWIRDQADNFAGTSTNFLD